MSWSPGIILIPIWVWLLTDAANENCGPATASRMGYKFASEPYNTTSVSAGVGECSLKCLQDPRCQSYNVRLSTLECMLLESNHLSATLTRTDDDWASMDNPLHPCFATKCENGGSCVRHLSTGKNASCNCNGTGFVGKHCELPRSCLTLLRAYPSTSSGYYLLDVAGSPVRVYCDMKTEGGGWSLVISVQRNSRDHTKTSARCRNTTLCVPFQGRSSAAVKLYRMKDQDIRVLAAEEGVFRLDIIRSSTKMTTAFYKIPSGAEHFKSNCDGKKCARIVVSYVFPYAWESGPCTGVEKGYHVRPCLRAFDGQSYECRKWWRSSQFAYQRALFNYCHSGGFYNNLAGYMYVR